jgi:hypothetical protein
MLQGVRSSCLRPVCSLRSEPRSAARSRSQRATRAEASLADRGLKSYSRLQLALDKLEKSLLAPRINKEAAQGQVQMVAADTLWVASEVGRQLSRAQRGDGSDRQGDHPAPFAGEGTMLPRCFDARNWE